MPDPDSELIKSVVSERLKHVDGLVKAKKIDEAVKEIGEIRKLDSKNPYALAYEERIKSLQEKLRSEPPPPAPVPEQLNEATPSPFRGEVQAFPTPTNPTAKEPESLEGYRAQGPRSSESPTASESSTTKSTGKGNIVLVDDDVLLVQALSEFLVDSRFTTRTFNRAEDALTYLKENSPDMIICDVNLETSTFGGFTLHEKLRKFEHLRDVPFVFLSGLNDTAIVLAGKELGADDYLTKPIEPEALLAVVKGKLKRYRQIKKNG